MKNILGEEVKYNILIRARPEKVKHKMQDVIDAENKALGDVDHIDMNAGWCWWTVGRVPKREGILKVLFTNGKNVFAEGKFYGTSSDNAIEFSALKRVSYPQPKVAPTRGYTYVDVDGN